MPISTGKARINTSSSPLRKAESRFAVVSSRNNKCNLG
ncbi:Uncharacterised protein [Vibrio cholerae]|nr:Uncharacterised protein [Vibrio cholerae]